MKRQKREPGQGYPPGRDDTDRLRDEWRRFFKEEEEEEEGAAL